MTAPSREPVILERELQLRTGRKQTTVVARFRRPARDRRDHECVFEIHGLTGKPIRKSGFGEDGVQALWLAMEHAALVLLMSRAYRAGRLTFDGSHDLRLPLSHGNGFLVRWDLEGERYAKDSRTRRDATLPTLEAVRAEMAKRPVGRPAEAPVIVERELELRRGRRSSRAFVRFRKPVADRWGFSCALQIEGLLDEPLGRTTMFGIDALDALRNTAKLAMAYLLASRVYQEGRLTWLGMYDLGLPVDDELAPLVRKDLEARRLAASLTRGPPARS